MAKTGKTGVSTNTPKNIMFGAGTIHKNLTCASYTYGLTADTDIVAGKKYFTRSGTEGSYVYTKVASPVKSAINTYYEITGGGWNFDASIIGATQGGSKFTVTPEITQVEADGALVAVKGLNVKTGETAEMEINLLELTKDIIKASVIGADGSSTDEDYDLIESKANIEEGDYFTNIAFVGKTLDGRNIIVILDNALCTSGLELSGTNKEGAVGTYTFASHAELTSDLDTLPYHIYYPVAVA